MFDLNLLSAADCRRDKTQRSKEMKMVPQRQNSMTFVPHNSVNDLVLQCGWRRGRDKTKGGLDPKIVYPDFEPKLGGQRYAVGGVSDDDRCFDWSPMPITIALGDASYMRFTTERKTLKKGPTYGTTRPGRRFWPAFPRLTCHLEPVELNTPEAPTAFLSSAFT